LGAEYVVKLMKCGGVTPALSIARIAEVGGRGLMWGCMDESAISIARLLSYGLWVATAWQVTPRLRLAFIVAILVFVGHVFEEYLTHLHLALPALFGRAPWSDPQFLVFNGVWALVFCAAAVTLSPARSIPVFIILFFAVAGGVGNGVLHCLLVLQRGAYFPGAWTAPLGLAVGFWLLRLLYASEPLESPATAE